MGRETGIEWCNHTFNCWIGCEKVSPACTNCYAENSTPVRVAATKFSLKLWGAESTGAVRRVASEAMWKEPVKWNKEAQKLGVRRKVFCASLADVFEDYNGPITTHEGVQLFKLADGSIGPLPDDVTVYSDTIKPLTLTDIRQRLFSLIDSTPHLDWLLLTKRPENVQKLWPFGWYSDEFSWSNVWMGITVENQKYLDERLPHLLSIPAVVRWLSIEPMLGPMRLPFGKVWCRACNRYEEKLCMDHGSPCFIGQASATDLIDWAIVGGESGDHRRSMNLDDARSLREQCKAAGIAYFFKQVDKVIAVPSDLEIRQFPKSVYVDSLVH